jgi:hypothetical protein
MGNVTGQPVKSSKGALTKAQTAAFDELGRRLDTQLQSGSKMKIKITLALLIAVSLAAVPMLVNLALQPGRIGVIKKFHSSISKRRYQQ